MVGQESGVRHGCSVDRKQENGLPGTRRANAQRQDAGQHETMLNETSDGSNRPACAGIAKGTQSRRHDRQIRTELPEFDWGGAPDFYVEARFFPEPCSAVQISCFTDSSCGGVLATGKSKT